MSLFSSFSTMVEGLPAAAVIGTVELQRRMIENDFAQKRTLPLTEAQSIVSFCRFIDAMRCGERIPHTTLPINHVAFYRMIIQRLVKAGELSFPANELFDETFSCSLKPAAEVS